MCEEVSREQVHGHQVTASYWRPGRSTMALRLKGLKGTKGRAEQRQGVFRGLGGLSQQAFRGFDCPFVFLRHDLTYPRQAFIILLPVPSVTWDYRHTPMLWFYMMPGLNLGPHAC